jgi:hypothetical protein
VAEETSESSECSGKNRSEVCVSLRDIIRNSMIRERCGVTEDVVTKIEKSKLR